MAATYRGRPEGSTGPALPLLALLCTLDLTACATPPVRPHPGAPRTVYAFVERPDAAPAVLRQGPDGAWRIERGVLERDTQGTPRRAVREFVRALEARDWPALRALAPEELREGMTLTALREHVEADAESSEELLDRLKAHVDAPIQVEGPMARMPYAGALFELRIEDGRWIVLDPD